jgi:hypothetical protein
MAPMMTKNEPLRYRVMAHRKRFDARIIFQWYGVKLRGGRIKPDIPRNAGDHRYL